MTDLYKAIVEIAKNQDLMKEIYGDLAKPGVQQVGIALETVLGFGTTILLPIQLLNEKCKLWAQKNMDRFRANLEGVHIQNVQPIAPEIGVPIVERLLYTEDESLNDMFSKLLAHAAIKDQANLAHPKFVNIICNLSPDEARILKHFKECRKRGQIYFLPEKGGEKRGRFIFADELRESVCGYPNFHRRCNWCDNYHTTIEFYWRCRATGVSEDGVLHLVNIKPALPGTGVGHTTKL